MYLDLLNACTGYYADCINKTKPRVCSQSDYNLIFWSLGIIVFSGSKKSLQMVTAAVKLRHLLLGRKAVTNLDSMLKSRDITLPPKLCLVKAMVFPVVM